VAASRLYGHTCILVGQLTLNRLPGQGLDAVDQLGRVVAQILVYDSHGGRADGAVLVGPHDKIVELAHVRLAVVVELDALRGRIELTIGQGRRLTRNVGHGLVWKTSMSFALSLQN
jgi:hypothetical protein